MSRLLRFSDIEELDIRPLSGVNSRELKWTSYIRGNRVHEETVLDIYFNYYAKCIIFYLNPNFDTTK